MSVKTAQKYKSVQVAGMTPQEAFLRLWEKLMQSLVESARALGDKQRSAANKPLTDAHDILLEFRRILDCKRPSRSVEK